MWIEPTSDGRFKYIERYTDPVTEKYKRVSTIMNTDSKRAWNEAQRLLNKRIDKKLENIEVSDIRFIELYEKWWKIYSQTVKRTTALRNDWNMKIARRFLLDDFVVRNIKSNLIQDFLDTIYYQEDYSFSTVRQVRSIVNVLFTFAKDRKYIDSNPVADTKITKKPISFEEREKVETKFLERNELSAIINTQRKFSNGKRNSDLTEFLAMTGMRIGEAIALKNENVIDDKVVVEGTLDYQTRKTSDGSKEVTKTRKSDRVISLTKRLVELLDEVQEENKLAALNNDKYNDKGFIFTSIYGNPIAVTGYNDSLKEAAFQSGIEKNMSSHIMRHTHISILSELGLPLKVIMDRVGHEKAEVTLQIYTHVTKEMEKDLINKLNEITI